LLTDGLQIQPDERFIHCFIVGVVGSSLETSGYDTLLHQFAEAIVLRPNEPVECEELHKVIVTALDSVAMEQAEVSDLSCARLRGR